MKVKTPDLSVLLPRELRIFWFAFWDLEKTRMMYLYLFVFVKASECAYVTVKLSLSCFAALFG